MLIALSLPSSGKSSSYENTIDKNDLPVINTHENAIFIKIVRNK
jgi:hypothetical protein